MSDPKTTVETIRFRLTVRSIIECCVQPSEKTALFDKRQAKPLQSYGEQLHQQ